LGYENYRKEVVMSLKIKMGKSPSKTTILNCSIREAQDTAALAFDIYEKMGSPETGFVFKSPIPNTTDGEKIAEMLTNIRRTNCILRSILNKL